MALLFALIGAAAIVAGALVYRGRRRPWITHRIAIAESVSAAVAAFALSLWADMREIPQRELSTQPECATSQIDGIDLPAGSLARSASLVGTHVSGEVKPGETRLTHRPDTQVLFRPVYVDRSLANLKTCAITLIGSMG